MDIIPALPVLYLEDFAPGQHFTSPTHQVDERQILEYACQFDPQPFHTDPVAAGDSFFQGLVASGWHTASMTMRLLVATLPIANGVIGAGGEANWPQPTRPGDILRIEGDVLEVKPSKSRPDRGIVTINAKTLNQRDEVVQDLTAKLVVFRKPN